MMQNQQTLAEMFPSAITQECHPLQSGADYQASEAASLSDTSLMAQIKPCFVRPGEPGHKDCRTPQAASDRFLMAQIKPCFVQLTDVGPQFSPERSRELCSPVLMENTDSHPSDSKETINPLMLTPPSAQLCGGRCEHKKVNPLHHIPPSTQLGGGQYVIKKVNNLCHSSPTKPCFVPLTDVKSPCFKRGCSNLVSPHPKGTKRKLLESELCSQSEGYAVSIPDTTFIKSEPLDPDYPDSVPSNVKQGKDTVSDKDRNTASIHIVPYPLALFQNVHASKTSESSVRNVERCLPKKRKVQSTVSPQRQKHCDSTLAEQVKPKLFDILPSVKQEPVAFQEEAGMETTPNLPKKESRAHHFHTEAVGGHIQPENGQNGHFLAEYGHSQSLDHNHSNCQAENGLCETQDQKPVLKMEELPFVCPVCSERFVDANQLVTHSRTQNHFAKAYLCSLCSSSFSKFCAFENHVCAVKYKGKKYFQCDFCSHKFKNRTLLKRHATKHNGQQPFQCVICSRCWSSDKLLYLHVKRNHNKVCRLTASFAEHDLLYCSVCSAAFRYMSALRSHAVIHKKDRKMDAQDGVKAKMDEPGGHERKEVAKDGNNGEKHENIDCNGRNYGKSVDSRQVDEKGEDHRLHLSHPPVCDGIERPYRCSKCPCAFSAKSLLVKHFSRHHKKKPYQCPYCPKDYPTPQGLRDHAKDHIHAGRTLYCYRCDRYFDTLSTLSRHNTNSHRKVFKCPKCYYRFAHKHSLRKHLKTHKRYFSCPRCPREFKDHPLLLKHMKNHEVKKYMCCKCLSLNSSLQNFKRHFRSHRGEICYLCPHCPQSFNTLAEVQEHAESHTEKPSSGDTKSQSSAHSGGLKLVFRRTDQNTFTCSLPAAGKSEGQSDSVSAVYSSRQKDEKVTACDPTSELENDCCFDSDAVHSLPNFSTKDTKSDSQQMAQQLDEYRSMDVAHENIYSDTVDEDTTTDVVNEEDQLAVNPLMLTLPSAQLRGGRCEHKRVNAFSPILPSTHLSGGQSSAKGNEDENHTQEDTENVDDDTVDTDINDENIDTEADVTSKSTGENLMLDSSCQNITQVNKSRNLGHENDNNDVAHNVVDATIATSFDIRSSFSGLAASNVKTTQPSTSAITSSFLEFSHYEKPEAGKPGIVSQVIPETPGPSKTPAQTSKTSKITRPLYNAKTEFKLLQESRKLASIFNDPNVRSMFSESFKKPVSLSERKTCQKKVILLVKPVDKSSQNMFVDTSGPTTTSTQTEGCFRVKWDSERQDFKFEKISYPAASYAHNLVSARNSSQVDKGSLPQGHFTFIQDKGAQSHVPSGLFGSGDSLASAIGKLSDGGASLAEGRPDLLIDGVKVEGQRKTPHGNRASAQGQAELFHGISGTIQHNTDQRPQQPSSGQGQDNPFSPTEPSTHMSGGHSGAKLAKVLQESDFKYNQQTQTGIEYSLYQCPQCFSLFRSMSAIRVHMRTHRAHRCPKCSRIFKTYAHLMQHFKTHVGEKAYQCPECSASFTYPSDLRIHKRIHSGEKPYKCAHCPREFKSMSELNSHNKTHSEEKPFTCSECPSSFRRMSDLKVHSRIHSGEKPYLCSECASAFKSVGELKSHAKVHTQDKPFKCSECPSAFRSASDLKVHTRTHTGEKPFLCSQCPWAFKSVGELKSHERRAHKEVTSTPSSLQ